MRWVVAASLVLCATDVAAERAAMPADATVFIRLIGSVRAEVDEPGAPKQATELDRIEIGTGSGFVISPHGYVLTNEHVIRDGQFVVTDGPRKARISLKVARIDVCFPPGMPVARGESSRCFEASVHSSDAGLDLAVLFVTASELPYVALGDSDVLRPAQPVEALGYPFGRQLDVGRVSAPDLVPEISTGPGTISALRSGDSGERRVLQINGTINPGNSGGPVVDRDGYAIGVVRARVTNNAGIGFAIPINLVKEFLELRGLEPLMPARRVRPGPLQGIEGKALALRLPDGFADRSPFRARVETEPGASGVVLRIDRVVSPWPARQLERALITTDSFESLAVESTDGQASVRARATPLLVGRATGTTNGSDAAVRMHYAVLDLGAEKLVARFVGPEEQLAYNESVFRDAAASLEAQRITDGNGGIGVIAWPASTAGGTGVPFPSGWLTEPSAPSACTGLPQPTTFSSAYPLRDITVALRAAVWDDASFTVQDAAARCATRRGSTGDASYELRVEWLGVSYSIEGAFVATGSRRMQLEIISPLQRTASSRELLTTWIRKFSER